MDELTKIILTASISSFVSAIFFGAGQIFYFSKKMAIVETKITSLEARQKKSEQSIESMVKYTHEMEARILEQVHGVDKSITALISNFGKELKDTYADKTYVHLLIGKTWREIKGSFDGNE